MHIRLYLWTTYLVLGLIYAVWAVPVPGPLGTTAIRNAPGPSFKKRVSMVYRFPLPFAKTLVPFDEHGKESLAAKAVVDMIMQQVAGELHLPMSSKGTGTGSAQLPEIVIDNACSSSLKGYTPSKTFEFEITNEDGTGCCRGGCTCFVRPALKKPGVYEVGITDIWADKYVIGRSLTMDPEALQALNTTFPFRWPE
ncbi:hypothetical protein F5879DRAFT_993836 [Lentinula edodes]|uniref:uncharacterized protein n=1 Tax=Lentinula edodes TaxID=5353 RepID=UPI001BF1F548|nr:uncharacterized protein C8R40DRAFT_1171875 [Lentinula edodes]KAF8825488.1 hypothetical protein HHX47_DHR6000250 [Lentinula edodes]KAH7873954.1 hypothetical protein C8R40DRAFT_1171875 [Lentinula edodes]KAJ3899377.1 hypothetical protein F5879DRAFT_993836 [Lentinula edodes]KAJ3915016.1 hypothetical protein F5877DRAFT_82230 [Lentinula edodes]